METWKKGHGNYRQVLSDEGGIRVRHRIRSEGVRAIFLKVLSEWTSAKCLTGTVKSRPLQGEVHYKGCLLLRGGSTRLECLVLGYFLEYLPPSSKRSPILMVVFFLFFSLEKQKFVGTASSSIFFFCLPYLLEWAPLLERAPPLLKISDYIGQKQRIALQCMKNNLKN